MNIKVVEKMCCLKYAKKKWGMLRDCVLFRGLRRGMKSEIYGDISHGL